MSNPVINVNYLYASGEKLEDRGSKQIGSFIKGTDFSFYLYINNQGADSILNIISSGIEVTGSGELGDIFNADYSGPVPSVGKEEKLPIDILYKKGIFLKVKVDTNYVGSKEISLNILSNDPENTSYQYTFFFDIIEPSSSNSDINLIYNNLNQSLGSVINIGRIPKDGITKPSFNIFNYGLGSLVIPTSGISLISSGGESLFSNPVSVDPISLSFNASTSFTVLLNSSSLGSKSFVLSIASNDPNKNPFTLTVVYEVSKPFDLSVKESSNNILDESIINLGSFNKKNIINKNITLSNTGVSYGIRVTNIVSEGGVVLINIPSLPFVLQANEGSSSQFIARFDSSVLGKRTASIKIQWEVSA